MKVFCEMHQMVSDTGRSFVNVMRDDSGKVGVWGNKQNAVLAIRKNAWELWVFDSPGHENEWWADHSDEYDKLVEISNV